MKPGTRYAPETSSRSPPSYRPSPTTWRSLPATSTSSHSFVNTERTWPPDSTRSAGSSPRATAIQCASMTETLAAWPRGQARGLYRHRRHDQALTVCGERVLPLPGTGDERQPGGSAAGEQTGWVRGRINCFCGCHAKRHGTPVGPDHMHFVAGAKQVQASKDGRLGGQP